MHTIELRQLIAKPPVSIQIHAAALQYAADVVLVVAVSAVAAVALTFETTMVELESNTTV